MIIHIWKYTKMKKIFLILFLTVFLVGTISAFEFDNVRDYDETTKTVTITNAFGLGDTIAEVQLNTPLKNYVPHGEDKKVAEFELNTYDKEYLNAFEKIDLYDKRDEVNKEEYTKTFERDLTYKLLSSREDVYNVDTGENELKDIWIDFDYDKLLKGTYTIGIFTDVYMEDVVEWIPTFYGFEIEEWAGWFSDADIITGLVDVGDRSAPEVFYMAPDWYLISGGTSGDFYGYVWNDTSWYFNTTIVTGLVDVGFYSTPEVFYMAPDWYLISGENDGVFNGYVWNDTSWYANTTISAGLGDVGVSSSPDVFYMAPDWYLISGNGTGLFSGYVWNETSWYSNITIATGLRDVGVSSTPDVFYMSPNWYLISGNATGLFIGYIWNETSWYSNPAMITGLGDVGAQSTPDVFYMSPNWYLISGEDDGVFSGFYLDSFDLNIISPENNTQYFTSDIITFSVNVTDSLSLGITNVSLIINGIINQTNSSGIGGIYNFTLSPSDSGNYNWTTRAYVDSGLMKENSTRFFNRTKFIENSITYNSTTYETAYEIYILNLSAGGVQTVTATFNHSGIGYTATKTGDNLEMLFTSTITHAENSTGNNSFFWNVSYGGTYSSTQTQYQSVSDLEFQQCNGTGIPFLNFSFKDEESDTFIGSMLSTTQLQYCLGGGTEKKNLTYTNTTSQQSYDFCLNVDYTLHHSGSFKYSNTSYPEKTYVTDGDLTSDTTNITLFLLSVDDGIYTTIQTVDGFGDVINGVLVIAEGQIATVWTEVARDNTDSAGLVTFFLNPDDDYRFTFSKSGCTGLTSTIRPTQVLYTQTLVCGTGTDIYVGPLEGIKYARKPSGGILQPGPYNFTYQIESSRNNIANASMAIVFSNGSIFASTWDSCSPSGCTIFIPLTLSQGMDLKGRYYVDIGNGSILLEGDSHWKLVVIDTSGSNLMQFGRDMILVFNNWESSDMTGDFNRLLVAFFFIGLLMCLVNWFTGADSVSPGSFMIFMTAIVFMGSIVSGPTGEGFFYFNNLSKYVFINNYILFILLGFITIGQIINTQRQASR